MAPTKLTDLRPSRLVKKKSPKSKQAMYVWHDTQESWEFLKSCSEELNATCSPLLMLPPRVSMSHLRLCLRWAHNPYMRSLWKSNLQSPPVPTHRLPLPTEVCYATISTQLARAFAGTAVSAYQKITPSSGAQRLSRRFRFPCVPTVRVKFLQASQSPMTSFEFVVKSIEK